MQSTHTIARSTPSILALLTLAACSGSSGSGSSGSSGTGGGPPSGQNPADVAESLNRLGVGTEVSPRLDAEGNELPENYGPLGTTWNMARPAELLVAGLPLAGSNQEISLLQNMFGLAQPSQAELLWSESGTSWVSENLTGSELYETQRAFTSADVDGDGREEIVAVWVDPTGLLLRVTEDEPGAFGETIRVLGTVSGITSLSVAAGDFDGDLRQELAVGLCDNVESWILFVADSFDGYSVDTASTVTFAPVLDGASHSLVLEAGNLDYDPGDELVVVRNEIAGQDRSSRYAILDDEEADHATLADDIISYSDGQGVHSALVADTAVADFDGDALDEVAFGGLESMPASGCSPVPYISIALDDAAHDFESLGGRLESHTLIGCPSFDSWGVRWVHVNAGDIDGDRIAELQVNQYVYELDWAGGIAWRQAEDVDGNEIELSDTLFFETGDSQYYDRSNSSIVIGDITGDGLDDLAVYRQEMGEIVILAPVLAPEGILFGSFGSLPLTDDAGLAANPVLLTTNVNDDSITLVRTETEHQVLFTEPILLAAIAAAPCSTGIGQNLDGCSTTFGNSVLSGSEAERTVSASAGVTVGFGIEGGALTQSEFEMTATTTTIATRSSAESYELTRTLLFSTGALEDTVVFNTVPMDRYTYSVLTHHDPDLIGREIIVDLPRRPILLQTEREFYNANILDDSLSVGEQVFSHTPGDHQSYKTAGEKNQVIAANGGDFALQTGPISVGQGESGSTEVGLAIGNAWSEGESLELNFEMEVRATVGGVISGFSVGGGMGNSLTVTGGSETTYTGSVGTIPAATFFENQYSFGLYTYVFSDIASGQQFEVIDYWVE